MLDFAVTGLGRCRTAWFAAFLSDGQVSCLHEFGAQCDGPDGYAKAVVTGKVSGVADTLIWLCDPVPADRVLVIHRDHRRAEAFQRRLFGVNQDLRGYAERLRRIGGLHVEFDDLDGRMPEIVRYLTGRDIDGARYRLFAPLRIEVADPTACSVAPDYWRDALCRQR